MAIAAPNCSAWGQACYDTWAGSSYTLDLIQLTDVSFLTATIINVTGGITVCLISWSKYLALSMRRADFQAARICMC